MIELISWLFVAWVPIQYFILLILARTNWKSWGTATEPLPQVSVWIALRNEEENLPRLLQSLDRLDYPKEKLQILLADDQSTDRTGEILSQWAQNRPNVIWISALRDEKSLTQRNGKANALAQLERFAVGEFYFFTDGDCKVPPFWIKKTLAGFSERTGLVIGITRVQSETWLGKMQEIDWWNTLGIVKVVNDLDFATTGLGNNMAIRKEAYQACGGFSGIPFSLTEDLEISKAIQKKGFRMEQVVSPENLVLTQAENNWKALLKQRKRWMAGAMTLNLGWKILLGMQVLFFLGLGMMFFSSWVLALVCWGVKLVLQGLFFRNMSMRTGQRLLWRDLIFFDFYLLAAYSLTILYYFWPSPTIWKSRPY
ncbi:glycosyltransferase family 2 protein [Algoriphagus sp. oki45]|uniref:glycosyltransferase n=1 Tax=Algoriphagus sp. oki45 TaxID=3067294 RepID=UPI0027EB72FE|nr:glycosyltransferase family 2 protein [Algoriphagus sp. oki45]